MMPCKHGTVSGVEDTDRSHSLHTALEAEGGSHPDALQDPALSPCVNSQMNMNG